MSSTLPFDPTSPAKFVAWLKANRACKEAVAWVGDRSAIEALEALAALEPTLQHVQWSCWVADRILPAAAHRRLRAALLRIMPEYLSAMPAVVGVVEALETVPFDPERFHVARTEAKAVREAVWRAGMAAEGAEADPAVEAAAWAAWMAAEAAWTAEKAGAKAKDAKRAETRRRLRDMLVIALAECLKG